MHLGFASAVAAAAVLTTAAAAAPASSYAWRNVRIDGGGFVAAVLFHPTTPGLAYARTDMGGLYRWVNASAADPAAPPDGWTPLQDDLGSANASFLGTLALALDPTDAERVYVAAGLYTAAWAPDAAVLVSTARGAPGSWTSVPLPFKLGGNEDGRSAGERLAVNPASPSSLLLGSSLNGLWASADRGASWANLSAAAFPPGPAAALTFVSFSRTGALALAGVRAGTGTGAGGGATLWSSTDGGATWAVAAGAPAVLGGGRWRGPAAGATGALTPYRVAWDADNATVYVTASAGVGPNNMANGTVWRWAFARAAAAGGGGAWADITPAPLAQGGYAGVAADASAAGVVMVSSMDQWYPLDTLHRSTDAGATWHELGADGWVTASPTAPWVFWHRDVPTSTGWMGDVAIDPHDGAHVTHTTGQGIWSSRDADAPAGSPTHWVFSNAGLEETAVIELVSPPAAPAGGGHPASPPLLSALGDIDGFRHDDLGVSPVGGAFAPMRGTNYGLDVAWQRPWLVVRSTPANSGAGERHISMSVDGGRSFVDLPSEPAGAAPGPVAVTADGGALVWAGHVSRDNGSTWAAATGLPPGARPCADRAAAGNLYAAAAGRLWVSTDAGATFAAAAPLLPALTAPLRTTPGVPGHLWLPAGASGLLRSTDAGASVSARLPRVDTAVSVSAGAPLAAGAYPALFLHGVVDGEEGVWCSGDEGATWSRVNAWDTKYGYVEFVVADAVVPGRVYVATNGRGIVVGEPAA